MDAAKDTNEETPTKHAVSRATAVEKVVPKETQQYALRTPLAKLLHGDAAREAIAPLLRPGDSFDAVVVEVYHAAQANPDILKCKPASIVSAVARAVGTGLVIGQTVHLVPFGQKLEVVLDYKGLISLVLATGVARSIDAHVVYEKEYFRVRLGTNVQIEHTPLLDPAARGKLVGAYAVAQFGGSTPPIVTVLSAQEIDAVRQQYSRAWKSGALPVWYAQKTVVRRLVKLLPQTPRLSRLMGQLDREDAAFEEAGRFAEVEAQFAAHTAAARPGSGPGAGSGAGRVAEAGGASEGGATEPATTPATASTDSTDVEPLENDDGAAFTWPHTDEDDEASTALAWVQAAADVAADLPNEAQLEIHTGAQPASPDAATGPAAATVRLPAGRKRYAVEETILPFGGANNVGRPLWQIATEDLRLAYRFLLKNPREDYRALKEAVESVLELRRSLDVPEPSNEDMQAPKPPVVEQAKGRKK